MHRARDTCKLPDLTKSNERKSILLSGCRAVEATIYKFAEQELDAFGRRRSLDHHFITTVV